MLANDKEARDQILPLARSISDEMMDLADRLGSEFDSVDPRAWEHILVYAPADYRDIAMDASRFRWLMADHKGESKKAARSIIDTLAVSSLSSARLDIDANIEEAINTVRAYLRSKADKGETAVQTIPTVQTAQTETIQTVQTPWF